MTYSEYDPIPNRKATLWKPALILCAIAITVGLLAAPLFIRKTKCRGQTGEISNLRQIGLALYEFENDYGQYPSPATIPLVKAKHPTHTFNLSGHSSNALFRQLFAANLTQSEQMFYAKGQKTKKPDGDISPGQALKKGEVGYAYISGLSIEGNPSRIIAFAPVIPGTTQFDPKPFDGNAVFLRIDNSVTSLKISKDGRVIIGGQDLLSPTHPIWGGKPFKIHYPDL